MINVYSNISLLMVTKLDPHSARIRRLTPRSHSPQIGVIEDTDNRAKLAKLLRFHTSKSDEELTSLADYCGRMKEGQKNIYYMAADSVEVASAAPFVEKLVAQGYEVLYLTEPIDEATVTNMAKFDERDLVSWKFIIIC